MLVTFIFQAMGVNEMKEAKDRSSRYKATSDYFKLFQANMQMVSQLLSREVLLSDHATNVSAKLLKS